MGEGLLGSLVYITSMYLAQNITAISLIKIAQLKRDKKHCQNKITSDIPFVDLKTVEERKRELSREKLKQLEWYVKKLERYTSEENLKTVYRNLKTLEVKRGILPLIVGIAGNYEYKTNQIKYQLKSAIGHEFLHMASSYYDHKSKEYQGGFYQSHESIETRIGRGLDEGYTELLASRIYNENNEVTAYFKEVKIARLLELFFDNPKEMENYYFNHNLPGFVQHMEQYAPRKEIIKLLQEMDEMNIFSMTLSPISIYKNVKIQMKLYEWFRLKNPSPQKLEEFEQILQENKIISYAFKNQKIKLQRTFQKGTPIFSGEQNRTTSSVPRRKTSQGTVKENNTTEKQKEILRELSPYQNFSFVNLCSEVFRVPVNEINILQATKLYCLMTNIDFVNCDRKMRNSIARQVETLILPDNEKTLLEKRTCNQLQKKLDSTWNLVLEKEEKIGIRKTA